MLFRVAATAAFVVAACSSSMTNGAGPGNGGASSADASASRALATGGASGAGAFAGATGGASSGGASAITNGGVIAGGGTGDALASGGRGASAGSGGTSDSAGGARSARDGGAGTATNDAGTPAGDIVGKISVGYQGWFTAAGDGSGISPPWWHTTADRQTPTPTNIAIRSWPDVKELGKTYGTGFPSLGNGKPANLFSSYDASTVDAHVRWMEENGIDTLALQRFGDFMDVRDVVATHVRAAAEAHGRKFYVMYDISGWTDFQAALKSDWTTRIVGKLKLTSSSAYARQGGKPVVCIWGLGFLDRPGDPSSSSDVVNYFQRQGLYVIGGVGPDWRTADGTRWSKTGFGAVYDALDAISPWMVGVIGDAAGSDAIRKERNEGDVAYCHSHGIDYQPCVLPGDLQARQRKHGDFMWHQFANMIEIGSDGLYVSMYDEYNEGNQIAKTAATSADVPGGSTFVTLDEDGTACSSDYYLRLTGDGGRMLKKLIPFTFTRPTRTR